jgi:hypothetical protein
MISMLSTALFATGSAICAAVGAPPATPSPEVATPSITLEAELERLESTLPVSTTQDPDYWGPHDGAWEFTLGGGGSNDQDFDNGSASLQGSAGKFLSQHSEWGVRQSLSYSDFGGSVWNASTRVFYDYHFGEGRFRPLIGANLGYVYGDSVNETFAAAPEAGFKWYMTPTAFVFMLAEYQFFFEDADDANDAFDDGSFVYSLGVGFHR